MYKQEEKSLSLLFDEELVIRVIKNPITQEQSFLIVCDKTNDAIITKDISIDGTKLKCE